MGIIFALHNICPGNEKGYVFLITLIKGLDRTGFTLCKSFHGMWLCWVLWLAVA